MSLVKVRVVKVPNFLGLKKGLHNLPEMEAGALLRKAQAVLPKTRKKKG